MPDPTQDALAQIQASLAALDQRILSLEYHWHYTQQAGAPQPMEPSAASTQPQPAQHVTTAPPLDAAARPKAPDPAPVFQPPVGYPRPAATARPAKPQLTIEDLLNPRTLAWTGGALLVAGIVFLVSIGIRDGWITPTMQVLAAVFACLGLCADGFWLYEKRAQGVAAMAMFATGIAGLFATLVISTQTYDFIDPVGRANPAL